MKIIEHYICGKNPNQSLCENGFFLSDRVAAVIDGVTSKGRASVERQKKRSRS